MKHLIFKYLNRHYYVCNNIVYKKNGDFDVIRAKGTLCHELKNIFNLTPRKLKWFIKKWCYQQSPYFNFKDYWETEYFFSGVTGSTLMTAGIVYTPYIPAFTTSITSSSNNITVGYHAVNSYGSSNNITCFTASTTSNIIMANDPQLNSRYSRQAINRNYYGTTQIMINDNI